MDYIYHVYIEDDNGNIDEEWGYFRSFKNAYKVCADRNEELGNDFDDFATLFEDIVKWGTVTHGCYIIDRIELED